MKLPSLLGMTVVFLSISLPCFAQGQSVQGSGSEPGRPSDISINAARDVSIEQKMDGQVTLENTFRDENDKPVKLGSYFGKKPVILVMPFYRCSGTCIAELNGMVDLFREMKFKVGREFQAVVVSIDPTENGEMATMKKKEMLNLLSQPGAGDGWHFLTGDQPNIKKLADEIGFRYKYLPQNKQYAHATGIMILTPQGKVARYFFGIGYEPRDVRLALLEAGQGKIGSPTEQILLYCYHYDPSTGKYGLVVFRVLQIAGLLTVLILGSFMLVSFRRDFKTPVLAKESAVKEMKAE